ncbi:hypothetical protein Ancab_013160 [Ancistrocladus abbreviatus]
MSSMNPTTKARLLFSHVSTFGKAKEASSKDCNDDTNIKQVKKHRVHRMMTQLMLWKGPRVKPIIRKQRIPFSYGLWTDP